MRFSLPLACTRIQFLKKKTAVVETGHGILVGQEVQLTVLLDQLDGSFVYLLFELRVKLFFAFEKAVVHIRRLDKVRDSIVRNN